MKDKTINIISKIIWIIMIITNLIGAIEVWFCGLQVSTFTIGFNYFFIAIMATIWTRMTITTNKN